MNLSPVQTEYKGYLFRSRLEARWAVFFDSLGVRWEYESEGYDLGDGIQYLPDFLLHGVTIDHALYEEKCDVYVEVKGQMTKEDAEKIERFYEAGGPESDAVELSKTAVLVVGKIPDGTCMGEIIQSIYDASDDWFYNFATIDGDWYTAYPGVDRKGVCSLFGDDTNYLNHMNERATERAYRRARQARFEFGETPAVRRIR